MSRAVFARNRETCVYVTNLRLEDAVVRDTQGEEASQGGGLGLSAQGGAVATVSRALFANNREFGLVATDPGTTVTVEDVVVRDTQSAADHGSWGIGLYVQEASPPHVAGTADPCSHRLTVVLPGRSR